jgi:acetate kinase
MSDAIFVLNAGSSSLKFSVYSLADQDLRLVAHGEIERLGASAHFRHRTIVGFQMYFLRV